MTTDAIIVKITVDKMILDKMMADKMIFKMTAVSETIYFVNSVN